jgi:hypothetical protein
MFIRFVSAVHDTGSRVTPVRNSPSLPQGAASTGKVFAPNPAASTATLQTMAAVAALLGKSRIWVNEICRELEDLQP